MDERLNHLPCGYMSLNPDYIITSMNQTLLSLTGHDREDMLGQKLDRLLTAQSRVFFQIYFPPLISLNHRVEEMYLLLKTKGEDKLPVLLNAALYEQDGEVLIDCILLPLRRRLEYEKQIQEAEARANKAAQKVRALHHDIDAGQKTLAQLTSKIEALPLVTDEFIQSFQSIGLPVYVYSVYDQGGEPLNYGAIMDWNEHYFYVEGKAYSRKAYIFLVTKID
ncbi:sigma-B regulation protein RsbU (phosphoserine phosphatase) [Paenibacillus phyllosphaerae]|uniref:Sigma-B regulation protein RsbU (Phosphoserine phosphatase) n=1 Tax=Paenibacillus phyllosphaerae TaxID=274593 RepID=A0A7W5B0Z6_9BACL|nr:PAS domain-containing protein [Paenibacillus phyllosphaerae]MBB3111901.1 sigma-B regulation protein RsbU (phosphoserine phosphatase) [Paenibacillus phyllosphaerae]